VRDALGNPVKTFTGDVSMGLLVNPPGGVLSGTTTVAAVAGVASFNNLSIDRSGSGYRLDVSSTGLASDTSDAIAVSGGTATQLLFTVQPSNATAGRRSLRRSGSPRWTRSATSPPVLAAS
jgi:hypothetical protein